MLNILLNAHSVTFSEHPVTDFTCRESHKFDITSTSTAFAPNFITDGAFNMLHYCIALLNKAWSLPQSELSDFLNYQCKQINEPFCWLNKFEKLISLNEDLLEQFKPKTRITKLYTLLHSKREKVQADRSYSKNEGAQVVKEPETQFDFKNVQSELAKLASFTDKCIYLIDRKTEYLQTDHVFIRKTAKPFDVLCDLEMEKLETQNQLIKQVDSKNHATKMPSKNDKVQINGNLNVLVDAFYQMLYEYPVNGKPFISCPQSKIVDIIVNNFLDKDNREISESTVRTILSEGKSEKRPKHDKRIIINA